MGVVAARGLTERMNGAPTVKLTRRNALGAGLAGLLFPFRLQAEMPARWPAELSVPPFECHADFPLHEYQPLFTDMRVLQADIVAALGLTPGVDSVQLFLFEKKSTYHQYVGYYFPEVPKRPALFIKSRGHAMVFVHRSPELAVDVRHECTHAVLHSALPMVPLWLDEGLAEYFEMPRDERHERHPALNSIRWSVRFGRVPQLEELEQLTELSEMTLTHYKRAWAWVHFMLHGPPAARAELQLYLADIAARTPPGPLSQRLRRRIPELESEFQHHFRG